MDGLGDLHSLIRIPWYADYETPLNTLDMAYQQNVCSDSVYPWMYQVRNDSCFDLACLSISANDDYRWASDLNVGENFNVTITATSPSIGGQDGSISIVENSNSSLEFEVFRDYLFQPWISVISPFWESLGTGSSFLGLDSNAYVIRIAYQDTNLTEILLSWRPLTGPYSCEDTLLVFPNITPAFDNQLCNGSVDIVTLGTQGNATYSHSPSGITESSAYGLCDGLHFVTVVGDSLNSITAPYIIPAENNVIYSINWPFDTETDTLFSAATSNCDLDFSLPIDSVYIDEIHWIDSNLFEAVWRFHQGEEVYSISHLYNHSEQEDVIVASTVYCENGRSSALGYFYALDQIDLASFEVGIDNRDELYFTITPNPSTGILRVNTQRKITQIELLNISARKIKTFSDFSSSVYEIDISDRQDGVYILRVVTKEGIGYGRVVKSL